MVDLKAKPFDLTDEEVQWVEMQIASMTLEEKLGQLFILMKAKPGLNEAEICDTLDRFHQGGLRWQGGDKHAVYRQSDFYQRHSKLPLFVAANCDDGGIGAVPEGTFVATAAEASASGSTETAYAMGYVAGKEASAIGVNWMFNPVADIYRNWRNTIVNTRSFGGEADKVIANCKAYIRGIKDAAPYMACTAKHFPGDGVDELDPHLALAINDLGVDEWNESFGKVYRALIEDGLETIMIGQIALPAMSRKLRPGLKDTEIMPATLAPELLQDLLRGELGFNGVIISDASHMIGMSSVMKRSEAVPACIAAGCDVFLFANDPEEDLAYMKKGYEDGIITEERLSDALHRILGLKARMRLYDPAVRFPDESGLEAIGCEAHHRMARQAAERGVTLVKDTRNLLPLNPAKQKNAFLVYVQSTPNSKGYQGDPVRAKITRELEEAGFHVTQCPNYYDLEVQNGVSPMNFIQMLTQGRRADFQKNYDVVFVFINVKGYAQKNTERLSWSCGHSMEMPWYNEEVPVVTVSLNYTNHLIDYANAHTFINAYGPNDENVHAVVEKIIGKSAFTGTAEETVFCGRWDTRL